MTKTGVLLFVPRNSSPAMRRRLSWPWRRWTGPSRSLRAHHVNTAPDHSHPILQVCCHLLHMLVSLMTSLRHLHHLRRNPRQMICHQLPFLPRRGWARLLLLSPHILPLHLRTSDTKPMHHFRLHGYHRPRQESCCLHHLRCWPPLRLTSPTSLAVILYLHRRQKPKTRMQSSRKFIRQSTNP